MREGRGPLPSKHEEPALSRRLGHDERMRMAADRRLGRGPAEDPVVTWTCFDVAAALAAEDIEVSVSQVR